MPTRATGGDDDTLSIKEALFVINESRERNVVLPHVHTSAHGVRQRAGLLEDLLEHEMRVTAFL